MLIELIELFENTSLKIESALEVDDIAAIGELDLSMGQTWKNLMSYNLANADEVGLLVDFLIDRLIGDGNADGFKNLIKEKLQYLCTYAKFE